MSGLVAVLHNAKENLTLADTMRILAATSVDCGDRGWDNKYGYGIVDTKAALTFIKNGMRYQMGLGILPGAQLRTVGGQALRFLSQISTEGDFHRVLEFGTVLIPNEAMESENDLFLSNPNAVRITADLLYAQTETEITFTACIVNLPESAYTRAFSARSYAIMQDGSVLYSKAVTTRSLAQVAETALLDESLSDDMREVYQSVLAAAGR